MQSRQVGTLITTNDEKRIRVCHISTVHLCYDVRIFNQECCSLARAGYRRGLEGPYFDLDWSYDIVCSYMMGAELNIK